MLEAAREEHRAPALAVIAPKLKVVSLPRHPCHDVADPAPRVEAVVQDAQLGLAWFEAEETKRSAEELTASIHYQLPSMGRGKQN